MKIIPNDRVARYLGWWLRDHDDLPWEPFVADGDAHEVCRERALLVHETRDRCSRWWITQAGLDLARSLRPEPEQLGLF